MFPGSRPPSVVLKSTAGRNGQVNFTVFPIANVSSLVKFTNELGQFPDKMKIVPWDVSAKRCAQIDSGKLPG